MDVRNEKNDDAGLDISTSIAQLNQEWEQYIREKRLRNEALEAEESDDTSPEDLNDKLPPNVDNKTTSTINTTEDSGFECESKFFSNNESDNRISNVTSDDRQAEPVEITTGKEPLGKHFQEFKSSKLAEIIKKTKQGGTKFQSSDMVDAGIWSQTGKAAESGERFGRMLKRDCVQTKSMSDNNKKSLFSGGKENKKSPSLVTGSSKDVVGKANNSSKDENNKLSLARAMCNENQQKSANNKKLLIFCDKETKKSPKLVTEFSKDVVGKENQSLNNESTKLSLLGNISNEGQANSAANSSGLLSQHQRNVENTQNAMVARHAEVGNSGNTPLLRISEAKQTNSTTPASKMGQNVRSTQKIHKFLHAEQRNEQTPSGRSQEVSKAPCGNQFVTPCRPPRPPAKVAQSLPTNQPAEEASSAQKPRIMCTIDMRSHLNTPIFQMPVARPTVHKQLLAASTLDCVLEDDASGESKSLCEQKVKDVFQCVAVKGVEYVVLNVLGKGGSSVVYHCYDPKSREERAVKVVDLKKDKNEAIGFINEVETLRKLQDCDHIIKLYDSEIRNADDTLFMVLEKGGRDFAQILREHKRNAAHLPAFMVHYYWMQMLHAVRQMHANRVIHSDLKPANFIEIRERLKLIDFGISSCVQTDMTSVMKTVALGTFGYISPEALCADRGGGASPGQQQPAPPTFKVGYKSDVWSLGCILYQLVYKRTPFAHIQRSAAQFAAVMDPEHAIAYPRADWAPAGIVRCMQACLQHDASKRPSVDELIRAGGCIAPM